MSSDEIKKLLQELAETYAKDIPSSISTGKKDKDEYKKCENKKETGCPPGCFAYRGRNTPASRELQTGCPPGCFAYRGRNTPASRELQTGFNEDRKLKFFSSSTQPGIIWEPVEEGRHFECLKCGAKATAFYLPEEPGKNREKKVFACDKCMWTSVPVNYQK